MPPKIQCKTCGHWEGYHSDSCDVFHGKLLSVSEETQALYRNIALEILSMAENGGEDGYESAVNDIMKLVEFKLVAGEYIKI